MAHYLAVALGVTMGMLLLLPVATKVIRNTIMSKVFKPLNRTLEFLNDLVFGIF